VILASPRTALLTARTLGPLITPSAPVRSHASAATRRPDIDPRTADVLREVVYALRERNVQRLSTVYREAFSEIIGPSEPVRRAYELIDDYLKHR